MDLSEGDMEPEVTDANARNIRSTGGRSAILRGVVPITAASARRGRRPNSDLVDRVLHDRATYPQFKRSDSRMR